MLVYTDSMSDPASKTFYLETFGCQMNAHDSEKVVGTLLQQGYRQVPTVEEAGLVRRCLRGDPEAVQSLVDRFQGEVFGVCLRLLHHRHAAAALEVGKPGGAVVELAAEDHADRARPVAEPDRPEERIDRRPGVMLARPARQPRVAPAFRALLESDERSDDRPAEQLGDGGAWTDQGKHGQQRHCRCRMAARPADGPFPARGSNS